MSGFNIQSPPPGNGPATTQWLVRGLQTLWGRVNGITVAPSEGGGVYTASIPISSDQILNIADNPVQLVPPPGPGNAVTPLVISVNYTFNTTPYSIQCNVEYDSGEVISPLNLGVGIINNLSLSTPPDVPENTSIVLTADSNPTDGDGELVLTVTYALYPTSS